MLVDVGEEATSVATLQAKEVGTSVECPRGKCGLRSLARGNAHTQSLGCRRGDRRNKKGRRRRKRDQRWSQHDRIRQRRKGRCQRDGPGWHSWAGGEEARVGRRRQIQESAGRERRGVGEQRTVRVWAGDGTGRVTRVAASQERRWSRRRREGSSAQGQARDPSRRRRKCEKKVPH